MIKVKNRSVIRRLAFREMKSNRKMNIVVIVSIMLTCILFTALTSIGGSLINGMQQETMRQVGGDRMAGLKCVLPEDYEKVREDGVVRDVVYRIVVGWAKNDKLKNVSAEVDCAGDENAAKAVFCSPTTGKLPEKADEIAVSTVVLDELEIPHKLGVNVPLTVDIDGAAEEHEFTLCGYWQGDTVSMAQICWVSRAFADKYAPTPTESFYTQEHSKYAGYWQVDFNFPNSFDIEGKTEALLERLYADSEIIPDFGVNWAYTTSSVDGGTLALGIIMILVIFAAGYLIIYNIFHINITANIRSYGLLKTIGTTSRQIRRMVRTQAAVYCAIGIPCGLLAGIFISKVMLKSVIKLLNIYSAESYTISAKLLMIICLISAAFTFITVMISSFQPCKAAGNISPIEALRYNETSITSKQNKKTGRVTLLSIAHANMLRSRKKTVIVVLSLTLSLVLVNTLFTILGGIDEDKYIANTIVGDVIIRHTDKTDLRDDRTKGVTPEMISDIGQIDGVDIHPVYFDSGTIVPSGKQLDKLNLLNEKYGSDEVAAASLEAALDSGYSADIYGIDAVTASYFEPIEGSIDKDKLMSGKYAIVHTFLIQADGDGDSDAEIYHVGDKISVECGDTAREYEVMAVCEVPYPLSTKVYSTLGTQLVISADEYMKLTAAPGAACVMINTDDENVKSVCRAYCNRDGSPLVYSDKQTYLDEFGDLLKMVKLLGGTLTAILALIGILNFVNAVVTGIISRKRELAMMNAVGMTGRQLRSMLMWEGVHYAALTAVCSAAGGTLLSVAFAFGIAKELFFYTYRFTLAPIAVCVPILLLLSAVIPAVAYRTICKESVVDRLREN